MIHPLLAFSMTIEKKKKKILTEMSYTFSNPAATPRKEGL